jgi:hypothetical protein
MVYNNSFEDAIYNIEKTNKKDFENLDWKSISAFRNLNEQFMSDFSDCLDWGVVCTHQKMTEGFLRYYSHLINYKAIGITQINQMSVDFIYEHKTKLNMKCIKENKKYWANPKLACSYWYKKHINEVQTANHKTGFIDDMLIVFIKKELKGNVFPNAEY